MTNKTTAGEQIADDRAELALQGNGRNVRKISSNSSKWLEIGSAGLEVWSGFISEAYHADLFWPTCYPLYNRIRRSDPEITIARNLFVALSRRLKLSFVPATDDPTDDDQAAADFGNEALLDLEGGQSALLETIVSYVPFMGWGWWEILPGLRREGWRPPGPDPWRSRYDDGLLGIRRLAWRDHSSFGEWDIDEGTGRLFGMIQRDMPNPDVYIPLERSLHLKFGDNVNPEGLSPLEAVWRLERIKYGLELVQGMGFEHSAGHLDVKTEKESLTDADKQHIKDAARAVLSASEGNYVAWPKGFSGEIKDIDFTAAGSLLEAIKYYGVLKLQVFQMQWAALSATTGTGSFAAKAEDTTMFVLFFNAMMEGFAEQAGDQLAPWLFDRNSDAWPELTAPPRLTITKLEKTVNIAELTDWVDMMLTKGMPLDDNDFLWIRERSGMPEALPKVEDLPTPEPDPVPGDDDEPDESDETEEADEADAEDEIEDDDVRGALQAFADSERTPKWIRRLLNRSVDAEIE